MQSSSPSPQDLAFADSMSQFTMQLTFWYTLIFCSLGIVLNTIGLVVFTRKTFWDMSMGFYNCVLACVNNLTLVSMLVYFIPLSYNINRLTSSLTECILIILCHRVFTRMSSWLDVIITVDRMVYISYPRQFQFMNKKKFLCLVVGGLFVLVLVANAQTFSYTLETTLTNNNTKTVKCTVNNATLLSITITTITMLVVLPFALMVVTNVFLIHKLKRVKRERYMRREEIFARSVVALNVLFCLTHLPNLVLLFWQFVLTYTGEDPLSRTSTLVKFAYTLSLILSSYNYIFPTLVNLAFNKLFRDELCFLLRIKVRPEHCIVSDHILKDSNMCTS